MKRCAAFILCLTLIGIAFETIWIRPFRGIASAEGGITDTAGLSIGDLVAFGHYEQDDDASDGAEAIAWIVADMTDGRALLVSKYALDAKAYNSGSSFAAWETCTLRAWLNGDFLDAAFTAGERAHILLTDVDNGPGQVKSDWDVDGGGNTQDRVFLLSYKEAGAYFSGDDARICASTDYAVSRGAYTLNKYTVDDKAAGWWWLRSPGPRNGVVSHVYYDGAREYGSCDRSSGSVRPALWISLKDGKNADVSLLEKAEAAAVDIAGAGVGDVVTFGRFEQNNIAETGTEPISWIVLDRRDGKLLLLSKYCLDVRSFNRETNDSAWENSTLRVWLNGEFLSAAFTAGEQTAILLTDVDNGPDQGYKGIGGGNNTQDMVFLLSCAETDAYFSYWKEMVCAPTEYAVANGAYTNQTHKADGRDAGRWWLRSPGYHEGRVMTVDDSGSFREEDASARKSGGVRPALWIDQEIAGGISDEQVSLTVMTLPEVSREDDVITLSGFCDQAEQNELPVLPGDPVIAGKLVFYIRDGITTADSISAALRGDAFYDLPDDLLARSLDEADTAVFIFPTGDNIGTYAGPEFAAVAVRIHTRVVVMNLSRKSVYEGWDAAVNDPPQTANISSNTLAVRGDFEPDKAISQVLERYGQLPGDEAAAGGAASGGPVSAESVLTALGKDVYRTVYDALLAGETVRNGTKGETALGVQQTLINFGQEISADGHVGPKTIAALNAVQSRCGLPVTQSLDAEGYIQLLQCLLAFTDPGQGGGLTAH